MKNRKILFLCLVCFGVVSCKNDNMESILKDEPCRVDTIINVTFEKDIKELLVANCAGAGCHSGDKPEGGLSLEQNLAYAELTKSGSGYVDTITPRKSILYSVLISKTNPMPPSGNLDQCSIDLIEKWMEQKAKKE